MTTTTSHAGPLSFFDRNADVGAVSLPGEARQEGDGLAVSGSGHNMWLERDEFHFVWSEVEGDWSLSASPRFRGEGVSTHRKAVLLVREGLDTSAAYAGVAVHGDGLTSIQYRTRAGALTDEIRFAANAPTRVTLSRIGDVVEAVIGDEGHSVHLELPTRYYVGLAVCSHVDDVLETVDFAQIELSRVDRYE